VVATVHIAVLSPAPKMNLTLVQPNRHGALRPSVRLNWAGVVPAAITRVNVVAICLTTVTSVFRAGVA